MYAFDTKAICTVRVTAAHTTQTRTMFWTLKHSTSYQRFSLLKKGNEKEIITHFLEAWKMLTKYCLCHISWRIFKSCEIVSEKTVRNKSFFKDMQSPYLIDAKTIISKESLTAYWSMLWIKLYAEICLRGAYTSMEKLSWINLSAD